MADDPYGGLASATIPAHWGMFFTKTIHRQPSSSIDPSKVSLPPGYTVVITGAGKGIGEYIAKAYAAATAQNIIITSRTSSDLERVKSEVEAIAAEQNHKISVTICPGDATKPESYQAIAEVLDKLYDGRLDCLITNAGGGDMTKADRPLHEGDLDVFTRVTTLNYIGPYFGMMALIPYLLKSPSKTLINIVSGSAHLVEIPPASYNVAKVASIRMTEVVATAYVKQGLNCFALHPGAVPTPGALREVPDSLAFLTEDVRLGGAVCVWLSKENPAWASGRYIFATWDMDEFKTMQEEIVKGDKLKYRMAV